MTLKEKKQLSILIKIMVVSFASYFIYHKLSDNTNLINFNAIIKNITHQQLYISIAGVLILMAFNWLLESLKWQFLIKKIESISYWKAIESVFCGLTWAVFTPNRIGEYGGRIFFLTNRKRIYGLLAMTVGQFAQLVVTNVMGFFALAWFAIKFFTLNNVFIIGIVVVTVLLIVFFLLAYFNLDFLYQIFCRVRFLKNFKKYFKVFKRYQTNELSLIFLMSVGRYFIFTCQYIILIKLLIPDISIIYTALMIWLMFYIQSIIPSLDLLDISVRSVTATFFFKYITDQEIAIMACISVIWFINLILPAIIGSLFVFKLKFFDSTN